MTERVTFPNRQAAAARNRDKILAVARTAFADTSTEVSMAEIARTAGVGMATLYRNFPGRQQLLEAVYADEVDQLCAAAVADADDPGRALEAWLRALLAFLPGKRLIVSELLHYTDRDDAVLSTNRTKALDAGRPLLLAAQRARQVRDELTIEQVFDMIIAIARIDAEAAYVEPMLRIMLDGLRPAD